MSKFSSFLKKKSGQLPSLGQLGKIAVGALTGGPAGAALALASGYGAAGASQDRGNLEHLIRTAYKNGGISIDSASLAGTVNAILAGASLDDTLASIQKAHGGASPAPLMMEAGGIPGGSAAWGGLIKRAGGVLTGKTSNLPWRRIGGIAGGIGTGIAGQELYERFHGGHNGTHPGDRYTNKDGSPRRIKMNGEPWKRPTMNVLNPRALSRADRRVSGFSGKARPILRSLGYTVSTTRKAKGGKKKRAR